MRYYGQASPEEEGEREGTSKGNRSLVRSMCPVLDLQGTAEVEERERAWDGVFVPEPPPTTEILRGKAMQLKP